MAYAQERYLGLLSQLFTTPEETAMEIIAEREELRFPKPTELFISDIHGEYEEFSHILRNGCGSIRKHIDTLFSDSLDEDERSTLATLVYYPEESIDQLNDDDLRNTFSNLISLCASFAELQPSEAVFDVCPKPFGPIVEKIMSAEHSACRKTVLLDAAFDTATEQDLAWALCITIQGLATSQVHIVGDVYDRGPNPDLIMDRNRRASRNRHPMGQPRRSVDGRCAWTTRLHCTRSAQLRSLRQSFHPKRCLRNQHPALGKLCFQGVQRRSLRSIQAQRGSRLKRRGIRPKRKDTKSNGNSAV